MLLGLCAPAQNKALKEAEAKKEAEAEAKLAKAEAQKAELAGKKAAIAAANKEKKEAAALAAAEVREPCPTAARHGLSALPLTPNFDRACSGQGGKGEQLCPDTRRREEGRHVRQRPEGGRPCGAHRRAGGCG